MEVVHKPLNWHIGIFEYCYAAITVCTMWLYVSFHKIPIIRNGLKNLMFMSGGKDTNAETMLFLRYLYTLLPHGLAFPASEAFWARRMLKPHFLRMYELVRIFGIRVLPPAVRFLYTAYYCRAISAHKFIRDSIKEGTTQILILGSGFDTTAFRFYHENVKFIEIDLPDLQRSKINSIINVINNELASRQKSEVTAENTMPTNLLRSISHEITAKENIQNSQITYAPCDFNQVNLSQVLKTYVNPSLKTAILLEGVTYYIQRDALNQTIADLKAFFTDAKLFMDYVRDGNAKSVYWKLSKRIMTVNNTKFINYMPDLKKFVKNHRLEIIKEGNRQKTISIFQQHEYFNAITKPYCGYADNFIDLETIVARIN